MGSRKHENGEIEAIQASDLTQEESMGGHVFHETEVFYLGDLTPNGTTAAVALIEHLWTIPLRDKIVEAGGVPLTDEWIHPADLIAVGAVIGEKAGA